QSVRAGEQPGAEAGGVPVPAAGPATGLERVMNQPLDEPVLEAWTGVPAPDAAQPAEAGAAAAAASADAKVIPFRFASTPAEENDHFKLIGPVRISLPLYNVYLQEADDLIRQFATDV